MKRMLKCLLVRLISHLVDFAIGFVFNVKFLLRVCDVVGEIGYSCSKIFIFACLVFLPFS